MGLLETAFLVLGNNRELPALLSLRDMVQLATSAKWMSMFHQQLPILLIEGAHCGSLKLFVDELFVDEIVDIERYLCPTQCKKV